MSAGSAGHLCGVFRLPSVASNPRPCFGRCYGENGGAAYHRVALWGYCSWVWGSGAAIGRRAPLGDRARRHQGEGSRGPRAMGTGRDGFAWCGGTEQRQPMSPQSPICLACLDGGECRGGRRAAAPRSGGPPCVSGYHRQCDCPSDIPSVFVHLTSRLLTSQLHTLTRTHARLGPGRRRRLLSTL